MKTIKIILTLWVLLTLISLASCSGGSNRISKNTDTPTETSMMTTDSILSHVDARFTAHEWFVACADQTKNMCAEDTECIAQWLDLCMMEAAAFTGDGSAVSCDQFFSEERKNDCRFSEVLWQAIQSRDVGLCQNLSGEFLIRCTTQVTTILASQSWDINMCKSLETLWDQVACKNQVLTMRAIQTMDASLCDEIVVHTGDIEVDMEDMPEIRDADNFEKQMCIEQVEMMRENFWEIFE